MVIDESTSFNKHVEEMQTHYPGQRFIYIVQGLEDIDKDLVYLQTMTDCIIMETKDSEETVHWIVQLLIVACAKNKHTSVHKIVKGRDAAHTWRLILQTIHGVSEEKATAIVNKYPTMRRLINAYNSLEPTNAERLLAKIKGSGSRAIGDVLSKRIYNAFTRDEPHYQINTILSRRNKDVQSQ